MNLQEAASPSLPPSDQSHTSPYGVPHKLTDHATLPTTGDGLDIKPRSDSGETSKNIIIEQTIADCGHGSDGLLGDRGTCLYQPSTLEESNAEVETV